MFVLVGDGDTVVTTMVIESSGIAISRSGSSPEDLFNYYSIRSVAVDRKKKRTDVGQVEIISVLLNTRLYWVSLQMKCSIWTVKSGQSRLFSAGPKDPRLVFL